MKEKLLFVFFIGIALLCSTCSKEDNELPFAEAIQHEELTDEEAAFWDNQEDLILTAADIILPNGKSVEEYLQETDPDFNDEWSNKSTYNYNEMGPGDFKNFLIAKMNKVALYLTNRSNFVYEGSPNFGIPAQNGLAYSYGSRNYKERMKPPKGQCTEEVFGLDCSGFVYHLFLGAGIDLTTNTWAEKQRKPAELLSAIKAGYPAQEKIIVNDLGKIEYSEFKSGDIIYWLKVDKKTGEKKAFHIGLVLKDRNGTLAIAQSNGHPYEKCQTNYGPKRGPRFLNIVNAIKPKSQNGFGDDYGVVRIDTEEPEALVYNTCYLGVEVAGQYQYITPSSNYTLDSDIILGAVYKGSFSGNTFTANYSEQPGPETTITGTIQAVLDEDRTKIESFDWSEQLVTSTSTQNKAFKGQNIPLSGHDAINMIFFVSGETVTDHITTLTDEQTSNGLNYYILDYWGAEDSDIYIQFYTDNQ